jgi:hypothetical protein
MPAKSKAQLRFMFANADTKFKKYGGKEYIRKEWAEPVKGKKLPKKLGKVKKSLVKIGFIKSMGGGGMAGMTTTSGGAGLVHPQLAGRAVLHRRKKHKRKN